MYTTDLYIYKRLWNLCATDQTSHKVVIVFVNM